VTELPNTSFTKSEAIGQLAKAIAEAQADIRNPAFDRVNPHFKNRYATLGAHLDAVRQPLAKRGVAIIQTVSTPSPDWVMVGTMLVHSSGEWICCEASAKGGANIQQTGSSITYLRRYCLAAVTGIVGEEDDDGEADRQAARPASAAPPKEATFSTAEAKSLMKALAGKSLSFTDLMAAMDRAGLKCGPEITEWPVSWKPRIKAWLDQQAARTPSNAQEEAAG